jgi:hypothetical protein
MSGYQLDSVTPQPKPRKISRFAGPVLVADAADAYLRKPSDSKNGNATKALLDFKK